MRGDILAAVGEGGPLGRRRPLGGRQAGPPFVSRPDWPRHETAAAIRTDIVNVLLDAVRAKRALIGADPRQRRSRRQVTVAPFAVWSELERHSENPHPFRKPIYAFVAVE